MGLDPYIKSLDGCQLDYTCDICLQSENERERENFRGVNKPSDSFLTQRGEEQWKENDITKQYVYLNVSFDGKKRGNWGVLW